VAELEVLSQNLPEGTEESHERPQDMQLTSQEWNKGISLIQVRRVTAFIEIYADILMLALRERRLIGTHE